MRTHSGFSLIELMVVVAIVAILSSVALPWYGQYVQRGVRGDGISSLQAILDAQERFYTDNIRYTTNLNDLGLTVNGNGFYITPNEDYAIRAEVCTVGGNPVPLTQCVQLLAEPQGGQVADGRLEINSIGMQRRVLPNNSVVDW